RRDRVPRALPDGGHLPVLVSAARSALGRGRRGCPRHRSGRDALPLPRPRRPPERHAMTRRPPCLALVLAALLLTAAPARPWDDRTGEIDMPWLGDGGRARMFTGRSACLMCPTGYTAERRWGRSPGSGEEPYGTVGSALRFLQRKGVLDQWP